MSDLSHQKLKVAESLAKLGHDNLSIASRNANLIKSKLERRFITPSHFLEIHHSVEKLVDGFKKAGDVAQSLLSQEAEANKSTEMAEETERRTIQLVSYLSDLCDILSILLHPSSPSLKEPSMPSEGIFPNPYPSPQPPLSPHVFVARQCLALGCFSTLTCLSSLFPTMEQNSARGGES